MPFYSPPWIQPGWPNLPDQGATLVNAAATGTALKLKQEEIQGKLAQLAAHNQYLEDSLGLKEREYELMQKKYGLQSMMDYWKMDQAEAAADRWREKFDWMKDEKTVSDQRAQEHEEDAHKKFMDSENQRAQELQITGAYQEALDKDPYESGTEASKHYRQQVHAAFSPYAGYKGIKQIRELSDREFNTAGNWGQKAARDVDNSMQKIISDATKPGKSPNEQLRADDFEQDEKYWGYDKASDTSFVARWKKTGVFKGDTKVAGIAGNRATQKEVDNFSHADQLNLFDFASHSGDEHRRYRGLEEAKKHFEANRPVTIDTGIKKIKMKRPDGNIGMVPQDQVTEALGQGYTLEQ
jgi:hypothetical protein